jgi:hypothetical protein
MLAMVVVAAIDVDLAASEEPTHVLEHATTRLALDDGERWLHLPSKSHRAMAVDGNAEAAFAIHEAHQPADGGESFLLIVRTPNIVTAAHRLTLRRGCDSFGGE